MSVATLGQLIVFEGPENTGKSTLARGLAEALNADGTPCDCLSFPGKEAGSLGALVYAVEHDRARLGVSQVTPGGRQTLHLAAHLDAIEGRIRPTLTRGRWIVLDRYWWSMWAHGVAAGLSPQLLDAMVEIERSAWGPSRPAVIFCTLRSQPYNEPLTDEWRRVHDSYSTLVQRERNRDNVDVVPVQLSIDEQIKRCLAILAPWRGVS